MMHRQVCGFPFILFFSIALGKIMVFSHKGIFLNVLESDFHVGDESGAQLDWVLLEAVFLCSPRLR